MSQKDGVGRNKRHSFLHEQSIALRLGITIISRSFVEKKGWDPKTASQPQQLQERGCVNDISCRQKANSPRDGVVGGPREEEALTGTKIGPRAERIRDKGQGAGQTWRMKRWRQRKEESD